MKPRSPKRINKYYRLNKQALVRIYAHLKSMCEQFGGAEARITFSNDRTGRHHSFAYKCENLNR